MKVFSNSSLQIIIDCKLQKMKGKLGECQNLPLYNITIIISS